MQKVIFDTNILILDQRQTLQVGKRKSKNPVVLTVMAAKAYDSGIEFYRGNNIVWLADVISVVFIEKP